jgi:ABC-type sugar transport system substrate-binding protein
MNPLKKRTFLVLVMIVQAVSVFGQSGAQPTQRRIAAMIDNITTPFGQQLKEGLEEAGQKYGFAVQVRAPVNDQSNDQQIAILRDWENAGFDVVMVRPRPGFDDVFSAPILKLKEHGTKVITLIEPLPPGVATTCVAVDEETVNSVAVQKCAAFLQDGDEISVLRNSTPDGKLTVREQRIVRGLRERFPKLKMRMDRFMSTSNDRRIDVAQAKALILTYPNLKVMYSAYTGASLATIQALRETGKAGKIRHVCVGASLPLEAMQAIEDGTVDVWIALLPKLLAYKAVETAVDMLADKPVPPAVYGKVLVVTKDNLHTAEVEALYAK